MKNTTKTIYLFGYFVWIILLLFLLCLSFIVFAITISGGIGSEDLTISVFSQIFINLLNLIMISIGILFTIEMSKGLFGGGINKKQLQRTFYFFLGSLALVIANYALLQNGISIFG